MKKGLLYILLLCSSTLFAQMEVGSVWKASGATASGLENLGFDSTKVHFLASGVFEISYIQSGTLYTETSTWQDLSANEVNVTYDPNGNFFGMMCPTNNNSFTYNIASNTMTLTNIQGTCTSAYSVLNNSTWQKVGSTSSAGINEEKEPRFKLYPNPVTDLIYISSEEALNPEELTLVNPIGGKELIKVNTLSSFELTIDVSHLAPGVYFIGLKNNRTLRFYVL